jgi:hypothetical protein
MRQAILAALLLAGPALAAPSGAAAAALLRVEREVMESDCASLFESGSHRFAAEPAADASSGAASGAGGAQRWVDLDAHEWTPGFPVAYEGGPARLTARERWRIGDGAVDVEVTLAPSEQRFTAKVVGRPAGDFDVAMAQYLPGVALPCEARGRLRVVPEPGDGGDPQRAVRVYVLVHDATEALYDRGFDAADAALAEARGLAPEDASLRWMSARAVFLRGESLSATDVDGRLTAFRRAEAFANEAIELEQGEGWLWRAIAQGRIATTRGRLSVALALVAGDGGPRSIAESFETAIRLRPTWHRFGHTARGDALHGAAQLYRLLPDSRLTAGILGVRGDLERAVALSREALALQPRRLEYRLELAVELLCRASRSGAADELAEGRALLESVGTLAVRTDFERTDLRHAQELLAAPPERACGYSRDAWSAATELVRAG